MELDAWSFFEAWMLVLGILKMVRPEVVATSPYRIKSPVPVCCGFRRDEIGWNDGIMERWNAGIVAKKEHETNIPQFHHSLF